MDYRIIQYKFELALCFTQNNDKSKAHSYQYKVGTIWKTLFYKKMEKKS